MIQQILDFNREFVARKEYEKYAADKYPAKKIAIVTCMDTRLVELLPAALGIRNGDVKMIKNAGGVITDPFDSTVRSLLVAVYELGVTDIMVIGHTNCGVQGMKGEEMVHLMKERGVTQQTLDIIAHCGIDLHKWLDGFDETDSAVLRSVDLIRNHPLLPPKGITVTGYVIDTDTGQLRSLRL